MDDSNAIYWHPHPTSSTLNITLLSWDREISVTKVSGNVELVEKICPLWFILCTLCYVWSWAWILHGRNQLMKCWITSVCLLVDLADLCTVSHANFVLDMIWCNIYFVDTDTALFRLPELVDWNILLWEKRAVHRIKLRWKAASGLVPRNCITWCWSWLGQWTWYQPDKCQTAAVSLGITLYPYHGHHQTEIKHLSGHSFTRPRHWSLGTSG